MADIRLASYNILNTWHAVNWNTKEGYDIKTQEEIAALKAANPNLCTKDDRVCNGDVRMKKVVQNLLESGANIFALQEVNPLVYAELKEQLAAKGFKLLDLSLSKPDDNEPIVKQMGTTIAVKNDDFEVLDQQPFQSPVTGDWPRGAIYADLRHKASGFTYQVGNAHLKGYNPTAEASEAKEVQKGAGFRELQGVIKTMLAVEHNFRARILCGDFNEDAAVEAGTKHSRDALMKENGFQFVDHGPTENGSGRAIDNTYILPIDKDLKITALDVPQDRTVSDHKMIVVEIS